MHLRAAHAIVIATALVSSLASAARADTRPHLHHLAATGAYSDGGPNAELAVRPLPFLELASGIGRAHQYANTHDDILGGLFTERDVTRTSERYVALSARYLVPINQRVVLYGGLGLGYEAMHKEHTHYNDIVEDIVDGTSPMTTYESSRGFFPRVECGLT